MTIAACYVCPEGVVFGADSTATFNGGYRAHHFNHAQKIFEIGESGTLGFVNWGIGAIGDTSYRTLVAELADDLIRTPPSSCEDAMLRWQAAAWSLFQSSFSSAISRWRDLLRMSHRTPEENSEFEELSQVSGGFCIGGRVPACRTPYAFEWTFSIEDLAPRNVTPIQMGSPKFWGCPNLINRLHFGVDFGAFQTIIDSGKWNGTYDELAQLFRPYFLRSPGVLPLRDAIDWIHSTIFITIKAMKFSQFSPVCGGPIEIAAVTTDRPFRWVAHKAMDEALDHHRPRRRSQ